MLLSAILLQAAGASLAQACAAIGVGIVALAAGLGIGKIGQAAMEGTARQPEAANAIRTSMIIIGALVEGVCLFGVIVCLLAIL